MSDAFDVLTLPDAVPAIRNLRFGYVCASTDPNHLLGRQNGYTSKINWGPDGNTGTIEVFPDQADAIARQDYIKGFTCQLSSLVPSHHEFLIIFYLTS